MILKVDTISAKQLGISFYYAGNEVWLADRVPPVSCTDTPFLTPRDLIEKPTDGRNEPVFLSHILQVVARCTGRPAEEVAKATTETAAELFGIL